MCFQIHREIFAYYKNKGRKKLIEVTFQIYNAILYYLRSSDNVREVRIYMYKISFIGILLI